MMRWRAACFARIHDVKWWTIAIRLIASSFTTLAVGGRMARIMLTLPEDMLAEVDFVARSEHRSRSELLREAVRSYLRNTSTPKAPRPRNREAEGIIERLRRQAMKRAENAPDVGEIIRAFRGPIETQTSATPPVATKHVTTPTVTHPVAG
jgi:CopG family transcriptional regulator/antitoxin EndoAI